MRPNGETDTMVGDGAAGLWGAGRSGDIVGCWGLVKDGRWSKERGRWLGARKGIIQIGLMVMGVGVGDS
jgi:hypothetical protein